MGSIYYGARRTRIEIDDVLLTHVEFAVIAKLRRNEGFALSWTDDESVGDGRSTVWISPSTELHFKYSGSRVPKPDRELLERIAAGANSTHGLHLDDASLTEPTK